MRTRMVAAIAVAGIVLGTAGCGGSSSSGSQGSSAPASSGSTPQGPAPSSQTLLNDTLTALRTAKSVRISGGLVKNGQSLHLDVGFIRPNSLDGSISGPFAGVQATFKIIVVGGEAYVLLNKQLFNAISKAHHIPSATCAVICGKYIKVPASQFGGFTLNGLSNSVTKSTNKAVPGVTATTINGQAAYRISDGHGSYLYIAANGTHYPLEITKPGTGTLLFSEWNSVPPIAAPPASQVISVPGGIG